MAADRRPLHKGGADYDLLAAIYQDDLARVKAILKESPKLADDFQSESPLADGCLAGTTGNLPIPDRRAPCRCERF